MTKIRTFARFVGILFFLALSSQIAQAQEQTYSLVCYYYRYYGDNPQDKNFGTNQSGWVWGKDSYDQSIYLEGHFEDGYFVLSRTYSSTFLGFKVHDYSSIQATINELCQQSIQKEGAQYSLLQVGASRYSYDYFRSYPLIFSDTALRLVVFGDSLSDDGNILRFTHLYPAAPYVMGRFSNGLGWTDHLGLTKPVSIQNWAYGGSTVVPTEKSLVLDRIAESFKSTLTSFITGDVGCQVRGYIDSLTHGGQITGPSSQNVYLIWAGSNDYLNATSANVDQDTEGKALLEKVTSSILQNAEKLYEAGARNFILVDLWNVGETEWGYHEDDCNGSVECLQQYYEWSFNKTRFVKDHNEALKEKELEFKAAHPDAKLVHLDAFEAMSRMMKGISPHDDSQHFDYGFALENLSYELTSPHGDQPIQGVRSCFAGTWKGTQDAGSKTCHEVNKALFYDASHLTSLANCWVSYFIHRSLYEGGWSSNPPELADYEAYCK